ncbi:uncharacterized protein [Eucyclogobius newberryi]|uniref:uncharacterized protein n=1 Tax=Eucyclogobius newberryi TaxID=166745 RepID=UPI003B5CDFD6
MKKGSLNFLGRKSPNLFATNVKMKDMENVELVLGPGVIPDSGTASVRARPTVKHYSSSSDSFQAFAVPTPTVPPYSPVLNGTKINGSVSDDRSSDGSALSVTDPIKGEILVPAPPSMAPPPPPTELFVLPPPEFMGDLRTLEPPTMPAPKPPSNFVSLQEDNFPFRTPPPLSPPTLLSTSSNGPVSPAPVSSPVASNIPGPPKFAPPEPPAEKPKTSFKKPPPKPIRISSVPSLDTPPDTPAPLPPAHTPTVSSFNPQSPAKLYSAPKSTFRNSYEEPGPQIKPKLLLEDVGPAPVVQNNTNVRPKSTEVQDDLKPRPKSIDVQDIKPQPKPTAVLNDIKPAVPKPVQEVREIETAPQIIIPPPPSTPPQPIPERKPLTAASLKEMNKSPQTSPLLRANRSRDPEIDRLDMPNASSTGKYSPLLERKLRNIGGPSTPKDTSPLALLKAAKQRDKHRSTTQESSASNQSSLVSTNSGSSLSLNSTEARPESPKSEPIYAMPVKKPKEVNLAVPSASPLPSKAEPTTSSSLTSPDLPKVHDLTPDFDTSFLPPPPEFDDLDDIEPPPSMKPPDPPKFAAPSPSLIPPTPPKLPSQAPVATPVAPAPPKHALAPPPLPLLPSPNLHSAFKSKPPPVLVKPKPSHDPLPTPATASQATLLNILKKKMMEMDQKMGSDVGEQEASSDDWGAPEDNEAPVIPKANVPKNAVVNKSATLDMTELKTRVSQKKELPNRIPIPTSNGPSRHQYGMTFTVRPGTKQPITLVSRGEP